MCTRKPFLCYLRDAVLPQQRFVSSFAKRIKAPNKKKIKSPNCVTVFYCGGCKTHFSSWHLSTDIRDTCFFFSLERSKEKVCLRDGMREWFKCGREKKCVLLEWWRLKCVSSATSERLRVWCVREMAEKQRGKQGNGRFSEMISPS